MTKLTNLIGTIWLIFWVYWFFMAFKSKQNVRPRVNEHNGAGFAVLILIIFAFHILLHSAHPFNNHDVLSQNNLVLALGFAFFIAGLSLAIWARIYLGKNWGMPMTIKKEPELVTSGPYRFIRHPIYSGILLAVIGSCMAGSLYWLFFLAIAGVAFIYSALEEEKLMTKQFPKAYEQYKKSSKMLIPYIF